MTEKNVNEQQEKKNNKPDIKRQVLPDKIRDKADSGLIKIRKPSYKPLIPVAFSLELLDRGMEILHTRGDKYDIRETGELLMEAKEFIDKTASEFYRLTVRIAEYANDNRLDRDINPDYTPIYPRSIKRLKERVSDLNLNVSSKELEPAKEPKGKKSAE